MDHLPYAVVVVWFCGCIFFAGRALNLTRLTLNNIAPGKTYRGDYGHGVFTVGFRINVIGMDPALLTEAGRMHQARALRNHRMFFWWALTGFILIMISFSYFKMATA